MEFKKRFLFSLLLFLTLGSAFADTCYDRRYGYYTCYPNYSSYPDQGQSFMEGAVLGIFLGGALNNGGYENRGYNNHWDRGHDHRDGYRGHHR